MKKLAGRSPGEERLLLQVLAAYRQGYFPMADPEDGRIYWYAPDPRAILPSIASTCRATWPAWCGAAFFR
nr:leucyl/phenylalanyl-tRNA--protein transferase family protein [Rhodothermus marinus]